MEELIDKEIYWVRQVKFWNSDYETFWELAIWYEKDNCFYEIDEYEKDTKCAINPISVFEYQHVSQPGETK